MKKRIFFIAAPKKNHMTFITSICMKNIFMSKIKLSEKNRKIKNLNLLPSDMLAVGESGIMVGVGLYSGDGSM